MSTSSRMGRLRRRGSRARTDRGVPLSEFTARDGHDRIDDGHFTYRHVSKLLWVQCRLIAVGLRLLALTLHTPVRAADAAFTQFIASLWPEAQAAGVSRATFDAETRGLEPDYKLPDLILPGRPATGAPP